MISGKAYNTKVAHQTTRIKKIFMMETLKDTGYRIFMGTHGVYFIFKNSLSLDASVCATYYTLTTLLSSVSAG